MTIAYILQQKDDQYRRTFVFEYSYIFSRTINELFPKRYNINPLNEYLEDPLENNMLFPSGLFLLDSSTKYVFRADQMAAHQMYGQTGGSTEPQIDQNMHNRNYYSTRYNFFFNYDIH